MANLALAIVVGVWFFLAARKRGLNPFVWAAIGAVAFGGTGTLIGNLAFGLASPIPAEDLAMVATMALTISFAGAILATWFAYRSLVKKAGDQTSQ